MGKHSTFLVSFLVLTIVVLSACSPSPTPTSVSILLSPTSTIAVAPSVIENTATASATSQASPIPVNVTNTATPEPPLPPERWQEWPVVPNVSAKMTEIYQQGLAMRRDPARFSKIGDCQNVATYFLSSFDNPADYSLGAAYAYLQPTIDHFAGSWSRKSLAVKGGWNVASILNPMLADPKQCLANETPLACEIRVNNPSIVIISMETWWGQKPAIIYEAYMRTVVDYILSQGVVPILATKADNTEGDNSINAAIARVAYDYNIPLWNFWLAVQPLPNHGLSEDGFHLTFARNFFDDPERMNQFAWPWRNLTALRSIDLVYNGLISGNLPVEDTPTLAAPTTNSSTKTPAPTKTPVPTKTSVPTSTPVPELNAEDWQDWPVVPTVHPDMIAVYQKGLTLGNNPQAFSKIGDGNASTIWFLTDFDLGGYNLGPYTDLRPVIDYFHGSFVRTSLAANSGFNTTKILDSASTNKALCSSNETPLDCELRLHKPAFGFILLGTNQAWKPDIFESEMRLIIEQLLDTGVVPIIATKADNLEGDHRINLIIARLAGEYNIPLWNFWASIQFLPNHGLQEDMEHLTYAFNDFSNDNNMNQFAWPWRNLTALQALNAVWRAVSQNNP